MIQFTIPLKTINPLNGAQGRSRGAVFAKAARRKKERNTARLCTLAAFAPYTAPIMQPYGTWAPTATLTRASSGKLDGDGLQAALKSVRDGIADALGVNDGSSAVTWRYEQKKCKRGTYGVEVTIT